MDLADLLSAHADLPARTLRQLVDEGIPHKGGMAQIAHALPELLGFTAWVTLNNNQKKSTSDSCARTSGLPQGQAPAAS